MTKAPEKVTESPADAVERIKREQAEKAAAMAAKQPEEPSKESDPAEVESTDDAALKKQAEENLAKALIEDEPGDPTDPDFDAKQERAKAAAEKLRTIALSYQRSSPDSHVVFGFGGHRFTLGELRALFNL